MALPRGVRLGEILALVRATAFLAREGCARHAFGHQPHVAQVVQIDPLRIESLLWRRQVDLQRPDVRQRLLESRTGTQRADVPVHHRLELDDRRGGIQIRAAAAGRGRGKRWQGSPGRERGCALSGAAPEGERLGDGVAGKAVGAVRAADGFARGEEMRDAGAHAGVHADAAHVVMRDRRHFDRLAREGLVRSVPRIGAFVAELSLKDVAEVFDAWLIV